MARLKVFATTSGIHDHVVAAPSRPAALKAWGARTDLFSMGIAKQVTDPKIVKQALERPGEVISFERTGKGEKAPTRRTKASTKPPAKRPSRAKFTMAEQWLEELSAKQAKEQGAIEKELTALTRKRDQLDRHHAKARHAAEEKVEEARDTYQAALDD